MKTKFLLIMCIIEFFAFSNGSIYSQIDSMHMIGITPSQPIQFDSTLTGLSNFMSGAEVFTAVIYSSLKKDTLYFSDRGISYEGRLWDSCLYYFKGLQLIDTNSYIRGTFNDTLSDCGTDFLILKTAVIGFQSCENPSTPAIRFIVEFDSTEYHTVIKAYNKYCSYFKKRKSINDKEIWNFLRSYLLKHTKITLLRVFNSSFINQYYND